MRVVEGRASDSCTVGEEAGRTRQVTLGGVDATATCADVVGLEIDFLEPRIVVGRRIELDPFSRTAVRDPPRKTGSGLTASLLVLERGRGTLELKCGASLEELWSDDRSRLVPCCVPQETDRGKRETKRHSQDETRQRVNETNAPGLGIELWFRHHQYP